MAGFSIFQGGGEGETDLRVYSPQIGMFPLILTVLNKDYNGGHYTPY